VGLVKLGSISENGGESPCWISSVSLHPEDGCSEPLIEATSKFKDQVYNENIEQRGIVVNTSREFPFED